MIGSILETHQGYGTIGYYVIGAILVMGVVTLVFWIKRKDDVITLLNVSGTVAILTLVLFAWNKSAVDSYHDRMQEVLEENITEHFNIRAAHIEDGVAEFLAQDIEDTASEPVVFAVEMHHENGVKSTHEMSYNLEHDIVVPLPNEIEFLEEHIVEDSPIFNVVETENQDAQDTGD